MSDSTTDSHPDRWILVSVAVFIALFFVMAFVSEAAWEKCVNHRIYYCTDELWPGYVVPGHWVHHPVPVDRIGSADSMGGRDQIKRGWSVFDLWLLWLSFVGVSVAVSALPGFVFWIYNRREDAKAIEP